MLYGKLNINGDQTLFGTADEIVEQIGKNVEKRYGDKYKSFIDKAVDNIQEYDAQLELNKFLNQIEMIQDDSSVELSKIKLSKIKKLPYIQEISHGTEPYFTIGKGVIYKSGDTYKTSTVEYTVRERNIQRPITRMYKINESNQSERIAVEMFTINDYMEADDVNTYTYPILRAHKGSETTYKWGQRSTNKYYLNPDLWKNTPLVKTSWKLYDRTKECVLKDMHINTELVNLCSFTPESCKNLFLEIPEEYRGYSVKIEENLVESINNKRQDINGFTFKLVRQGDKEGIEMMAPTDQTIDLTANEVRLALIDRWEFYYTD